MSELIKGQDESRHGDLYNADFLKQQTVGGTTLWYDEPSTAGEKFSLYRAQQWPHTFFKGSGSGSESAIQLLHS